MIYDMSFETLRPEDSVVIRLTSTSAVKRTPEYDYSSTSPCRTAYNTMPEVPLTPSFLRMFCRCVSIVEGLISSSWAILVLLMSLVSHAQ